MGLFTQLRTYVRFTSADEDALRALAPRIRPHFQDIVETFYDRALEHEDARQALLRGEKHVGQLKVTLLKWLEELFSGPWDARYYERRARIGRVHVQITLPQQFMVSAMNVVRLKLRERLTELVDEHTPEGQRVRDAVQRILDIDLAIMLHTYRQDLEAQNARAERLATFGQLVGSIGHELRNPLGVIETSLYVLKSQPPSVERTQKHLDRIGQQVVLANEIITQLLDLIRDRPLAKQQIDLSTVLADVMAISAHPIGVSLQVGGEAGPYLVHGDPTQLRQVISNLVDNAVHAASPIGSVRVALAHDESKAVVLTVDDTGTGVDPSIRNRLFEPLVTTKPKGIGLGLALVRRILERHTGTIEVSKAPLGGARFTVWLPPVGQPATSPGLEAS